jgi:hypothetical protein
MRAVHLWWVTGDCRRGDMIGLYAAMKLWAGSSFSCTHSNTKPTISDPAVLSDSLLLFETWRLSAFCITSAGYYLTTASIYKHCLGRDWTLKSVNAQDYVSGWLIFPRILCFCDFSFTFWQSVSSRLTGAMIWRDNTIKRKAEVWQPDERNNDLFQDNDSKEEISKEYDHKNVRL